MDQVLTIEILGQSFTFKADVNCADAQTVADYVVQSVNQARAQCAGNTLNPDKRAILTLTALNIANELFDLKRRHQHLLHDIQQRSGNMLNTLDSQLGLT
ncbi:MAG: cell division protein ZapA [Desulfatitalea sp.]|nr:cell division protein ZapA [Desulfatitalea sp.]